MKQCLKCNSRNIKKSVKDLNSDNVIHIFTCQDCGNKESTVINLNEVCDVTRDRKV